MTGSPDWGDWEYHRNGVSGHGFFVKCDEKKLSVSWSNEEGEPGDVVHVVRLKWLRLPVDSMTIEVNRTGIWLFDRTGVPRPTQRMVAITDLAAYPSDYRTAVFAVNLLPDVRFMYNSWRGDRWHVAAVNRHQRVEL